MDAIMTLRAHLLRDQFRLGYARLRHVSPEAVLARINAPYLSIDGRKMAVIPRLAKVTTADIVRELPEGQTIVSKMRGKGKVTPALQRVLDDFDSEGVDVSKPSVKGDLHKASKALGLTTEEIDRIAAMANKRCSHAEYIGLGKVTIEQLMATGLFPHRRRKDTQWHSHS